jgi:hypothetical protein
MLKKILILSAAAIALGRIFITPRLTGIPSVEGSYEAIAHIVVGFLIFVPFYDWKQQLGPTRLYGCIGWVLAFWELGWFLAQSHNI